MAIMNILQVPILPCNNQYVLVIQDYLAKGAKAIPIPDQSANRITSEFMKVLSHYGLSDIQGLKALWLYITTNLGSIRSYKTKTMAYNPQVIGMVEQCNQSILPLLSTYVEHKEQCLPFVLFAYRIPIHTSKEVSLLELMFGQCPYNIPPLRYSLI